MLYLSALLLLQAVSLGAALAGRTSALIPLLIGQGVLLVFFIWFWWKHPSDSSRKRESISTFESAFRISRETMPFLRQGLNEDTAQSVAEVIREIAAVDAVAVTDTERILGLAGRVCPNQHRGGQIITNATRHAIDTGEFCVIRQVQELDCPLGRVCTCTIRSVVIAPFGCQNRVSGTVKLYLHLAKQIPDYVPRLAQGIAQILGMQMELAEIDHQRELVAKAKLEALQAQIRPHFLFNVLNTIIAISRTDADEARNLLIHLADFFRRSLRRTEGFITVGDEMEYINTYLTLEKARYGEKLKVNIRFDPRALRHKIPVLCVQPIVENAIIHGLATQEQDWRLRVSAKAMRGEIRMVVADNGVGMSRENLDQVLRMGYGTGMGLGLSNVNERLCSLYGEDYKLRIRTAPGKGTVVLIRIPIRCAEEETDAEEEAEQDEFESAGG